MPATGNWLVARRLMMTILFKLMWLVFTTVQRIFWQLNGTAKKQREAQLPHNYRRSAHVLDVVMAHKLCALGMRSTKLRDFLCTHNRFEDPQYIIDNDNITLLIISENYAVFCEPEDKGMHLWRASYGSFLRPTQMKFCRRLIVVPLTTFHRLADDIGDPDGEIIFLFNTARCGSTLFVQIMEHTGRCVSISEPGSLNTVAVKYRKFGDTPEVRRLARDVIRWECRPYPTLQPPALAYLLKLASPSTVALPLFSDLFPSGRHLFMYRDIETVAKSIYRMSLVLPLAHVGFVFGKLSGRVGKAMVHKIGYNGDDFDIRFDNDLIAGVIMAIAATSKYLEIRRSGFDIQAVRYEDLISHPLDMCRVILEYCHLPISLTEQAVKAFDIDSQENSAAAKSIIGHFKEPEVTPQIKAQLNALLSKHGMPLIGEPGIIEGTLKCC